MGSEMCIRDRYYILDGENKENITDRVIVEHEGGAEDNLKISQ